MTKKFLFIIFVWTLASCKPEPHIDEDLHLQTFDSSSVAVRSYQFKDEYTRGLLDTCTAMLTNDTLVITFGKEPALGNNCFKVFAFSNKYFGYFLHSDDGGAYKTLDQKVSMENIRLVLYKDKYKIGDTISGWLWATSRLYHFKDITTRDKFEGGFKAIINSGHSNKK